MDSKQNKRQKKKKPTNDKRYYLSCILDILYFVETICVHGPLDLKDHPSRTKAAELHSSMTGVDLFAEL